MLLIAIRERSNVFFNVLIEKLYTQPTKKNFFVVVRQKNEITHETYYENFYLESGKVSRLGRRRRGVGGGGRGGEGH